MDWIVAKDPTRTIVQLSGLKVPWLAPILKTYTLDYIPFSLSMHATERPVDEVAGSLAMSSSASTEPLIVEYGESLVKGIRRCFAKGQQPQGSLQT